MNAKETGERIRYFRTKKNLTQNALAYQAGVSPTYIYQLERGEKSPTVEYLGHICWGLGITLEEFFRDITEKTAINCVSELTDKQIELLNEFLNSLK